MSANAVKIPFTEAAAPSTPAAGKVVIYAKADGLMYQKDDAGTETLMASGSAGSVATDTIWDAAGDLAVGSGANTAAKLAIGATNGMVLMRVSGAVAWALPPGHELAYVEFTSSVTVAGTSEATGTSVVSAGAVTFDGSTRVCIEFYAPYISLDGPDGLIILDLSDGGSEIGRMGTWGAEASSDARTPVLVRRFLTPSAASHTYSIQAWYAGGTNRAVGAGAGGSGALMPGYIRITKA